MDASYKIQRGIHVHLIQFFMCPEFWVHITVWDAFLRFSLHTAGAAFFYLFCPEKVYIAYQLAYDKI